MVVNSKEMAEVLVEALPYIQKYRGEIVVVKYGGNAMVNDSLKRDVMSDLVLLTRVGVKVVLVHGGGPEINSVLEKMNIPTEFVGGLRKTDAETMKVVQMVLAGKVNKDLVNLIENTGGKAIGLCGIDGHMIEARPVNAKLGFVGEITNIDTRLVLEMLDAGFIPVVSTIGYDNEGNVYNINADTVAARLAGALKANALISMTDVKGILQDKNDESTLISQIAVSDAPHLIKLGVIQGGMLPKVECCIEAIRRGVKKVFIIDGRVPHSIVVEMLSDTGTGTMFF
ncbi:MAG: acetylglutamate kinase [Clostridia bacterium]